MREIEASTCIRFRQRRNERDYVLMVNGKGWASVQVDPLLTDDNCNGHTTQVSFQSRQDGWSAVTFPWSWVSWRGKHFAWAVSRYRTVPWGNISGFSIARSFLFRPFHCVFCWDKMVWRWKCRAIKWLQWNDLMIIVSQAHAMGSRSVPEHRLAEHWPRHVRPVSEDSLQSVSSCHRLRLRLHHDLRLKGLQQKRPEHNGASW